MAKRKGWTIYEDSERPWERYANQGDCAGPLARRYLSLEEMLPQEAGVTARQCKFCDRSEGKSVLASVVVWLAGEPISVCRGHMAYIEEHMQALVSAAERALEDDLRVRHIHDSE